MKHTGTQIINTSRLLLRPFMRCDSNDMFAYWATNPNVQTDYGEPVYTSKEEVKQLLKKWINQYHDLEFYRWAIIEKRSNQNLGQIALCKVYSDITLGEIEYCIGEHFWGNGYAGEALSAVIDFLFTHTGFSRLEAYHREANLKSGRVLEKSSMKITDQVERFRRLNQFPHGEICYAITKEDYIAGAGR